MESRSAVVADGGGRTRPSRFWSAYDETSLFLIAITCGLLVATYPSLRHDLGQLMSARDDEWGAFLVIGVAGSSLLAVYHVFTTRRKYLLEKVALASLAAVTSGAAAVLTGLEILRSGTYMNAVFPALNIVGGVMLFYQLGIAQESVIHDDNATTASLIVGLCVLGVLFAYCHLVRDSSWPLTFSVCVGYSTFAHKVFDRLQYLWWMR